MNLTNTQKGQNLIEIVVMLGVLMTVLSAVVVISVNGLKNSQFAKNQLLATKLAQEGIDKVKLAKNKNCKIKVGASNYTWYGTSTVWDVAVSANYSLDLSADPCLVDGQAKDPIGGTYDSQFTRVINIVDDGATANKRKKVTSEVSWGDLSGTHSSKIVTLISNN